MTGLWEESWFASRTRAQRDLWRGVEAQHRVATMRLVDDLQDQEILEQLLEGSKPPLPPAAKGLHYLLSTPFRYPSPWASRFRVADQPGAWYGADEPATVAAEIAHWRWRFFVDSEGLRQEELVTEHTFFQARFSGLELDLTIAPWSTHRDIWRAPDDYAMCHRLAQASRQLQPASAAIRYESARREGGLCVVVFDPSSLSLPGPHLQQTWICKTTRSLVLLVHDAEVLQFSQGAL
jgi:hypothetical protein